ADECTKAAASRRIERYSQCSGTFLPAYVSCDGESSGQRGKIPPSTNTSHEHQSCTPVLNTGHEHRSRAPVTNTGHEPPVAARATPAGQGRGASSPPLHRSIRE